MQLLSPGSILKSPGGNFIYEIQGPCCMLFDREDLPWPCCSLQWKGKQPSWNRIGKRFVPDVACSRSPAYWVKARDSWGNEWMQVVVVYYERLDDKLKAWWYSRYVPGTQYQDGSPHDEGH
jgi:hypothetical protein